MRPLFSCLRFERDTLMFKSVALFFSVFALMSLASGAQAQDVKAEDTPHGRAPAALMEMLSASYKCQALTGADFYKDAKQTVTNITMKLSGDDAELTEQFVGAIEGLAQAQCPNTNTCWRDYLGVDASVTAEAAKPMCEQKILDSMSVVSGILEEIIQEQS